MRPLAAAAKATVDKSTPGKAPEAAA